MKKVNLMIMMLMTILVMQSCSESVKYGTLTGNVYWKYNDYVGNKADAGSEIFLFLIDSTKYLKFEATADLQGNYKIEKIPTGEYFLVVKSKNTTGMPKYLLKDLSIYNHQIKQIFPFNIDKYNKEIKDIELEDSLALVKVRASTATLNDYLNYTQGGKFDSEFNNRIGKLIELFPYSFKKDIHLNSQFNSYNFSLITIEENKIKNIITDFGTTYF